MIYHGLNYVYFALSLFIILISILILIFLSFLFSLFDSCWLPIYKDPSLYPHHVSFPSWINVLSCIRRFVFHFLSVFGFLGYYIVMYPSNCIHLIFLFTFRLLYFVHVSQRVLCMVNPTCQKLNKSQTKNLVHSRDSRELRIHVPLTRL